MSHQPEVADADEPKVFPLQKNVRPAHLHCLYERLNKVVVLLPTDTLVLPTYVDRIVEQSLVISAHIEQNGQAVFRRNAAQRGVERHLADGNSHAARALVAQSEDALSIAYHDAAHIVIARVGQYLRDAILVGVAEE